MLRAVVEALATACGFRAREVLLFGFGQGGMAALAVAAAVAAARLGEEGRGVVAVGGPVPSSTLASAASTLASAASASASPPKNRTPIPALGGSSQTLRHHQSKGRLRMRRG